MYKWDYLTLVADNPSPPEVKQLGEQEWEMVTVVPIMAQTPLGQPKGMFVFYFKRVKQEAIN